MSVSIKAHLRSHTKDPSPCNSVGQIVNIYEPSLTGSCVCLNIDVKETLIAYIFVRKFIGIRAFGRLRKMDRYIQEGLLGYMCLELAQQVKNW
jgi:hypothetical protein